MIPCEQTIPSKKDSCLVQGPFYVRPGIAEIHYFRYNIGGLDSP